MNRKMDAETIGLLLDGCFMAKKITETLPELPKGMKPRQNYVLHAVYIFQKEAEGCRVSDVSKSLGTTMPSVTKLVSELSDRGLLEKYQDEDDGRVTLLRLTESGYQYVKKYVLDFHSDWAKNMQTVSALQVAQAIEVLTKFRDAMPQMRKGGEK